MIQTETNLDKLIQNMTPVLHDEEYVFHLSDKDLSDVIKLNPQQFFQESEGIACILKKSVADQGKLEYQFTSRMITLNVYSDLEAVGFLAAITRELAASGISVNPVSAYHHDHLFVPTEKAEQSMTILKKMAVAS